jgi:hypothetical protein
MTSFSKPSIPVFSTYVPVPKNLKVDFIYNYYVYDESTNSSSGIPEALKKKSSEQINTEITNFSLRVPRYVQLTWDPPPSSNFSSASPLFSISENIEKIVSEDNFVSSRFSSYSFSSLENIEKAYEEINNKKNQEGISQAGIIDNYVVDLLKNYSETGDETNIRARHEQIINAVGSLERIADRPTTTLGVGFYDENGKKIEAAGFDQLVSEAPILYAKINSLVLPDVFASSSMSKEDIKSINNNYQISLEKNSAVDDAIVKPIFIGEKIKIPENVSSNSSVIGYLIERYELINSGYVKNKTVAIENAAINSYIDFEVKYGATYYYSVKSISRIDVPGYDDEYSEIRSMMYYISSSPISKSVFCVEIVPPPPPVDINFVWNYKKKSLQIIWGMPPNTQRDIKQFQIFRRRSIDEPFELIRQKCFDYSQKKYTTGEVIDGNFVNMTQENSSFVDYEKQCSFSHIDDEFSADIENLTSSKYIYTVASIDAHGMVSNYGAQFEVTFDFFKNKITKKLISSSGAPRQYPNMYLDVDLFKDVIKTSGSESINMKIYFMPEYFKIAYNNGTVQQMLFSKQQNSFYKMQFINLQNQKTDSLKITIDDPHDLVK